MTLSVDKSPEFSTLYQESTSGKDTAIRLWVNPLWSFTLNFNHLRAREMYEAIAQVPIFNALNNVSTLEANDVGALLGFFGARYGKWDNWLFDDWTDDFVAQAQIGTGNASATQFQAYRLIGGQAVENLQNLNGTPVLASTWQASTPFASGALTIPTLNGIRTQFGLVVPWQTPGWPNYFSASAGTSGSSEPNWRNAPIAGTTLTDGSITWTNQGVPIVLYQEFAPAAWAASNAYALGTVILPTSSNAGGFIFVCTTAGTSGSSQPTWSQTIGGTNADSGVTWTNLGTAATGVGGSICPIHTSLYSINSTGLITFTSAPANTVQVFLTSGFYFRCRFKQDSQQLAQFLNNVWQGKTEFTSIKV
jgi:hypothetical protein